MTGDGRGWEGMGGDGRGWEGMAGNKREIKGDRGRIWASKYLGKEVSAVLAASYYVPPRRVQYLGEIKDDNHNNIQR